MQEEECASGALLGGVSAPVVLEEGCEVVDEWVIGWWNVENDFVLWQASIREAV